MALDGNPYENDALDAFEAIDDTTHLALNDTVLSNATVSVGGPTAFYADMRDIGERDFKVLFVVLLAAIFIVLALLLRSVIAPIYLLAPLPNLRQIGFGVTVGILIDTFLVRSLLVPSATVLLGRWAFWPTSPSPATDQSLDHDEAADPVAGSDRVPVATATPEERQHSWT